LCRLSSARVQDRIGHRAISIERGDALKRSRFCRSLRSGPRFWMDPGLQTGLQLGNCTITVASPEVMLTCDNARLLPVADHHFRSFFALVMRRSGVRFSSQPPRQRWFLTAGTRIHPISTPKGRQAPAEVAYVYGSSQFQWPRRRAGLDISARADAGWRG
jgi:hypothetical protein